MLLLAFPLAAAAQGVAPENVPPPPGIDLQAPPPPPETFVSPPQVAPSVPPPAAVAAPAPVDGQWVSTAQYGWIWMPYGDRYTYLPAGGVAPDMYVYYPAFGWRWVVAPWVWGLGPQPYSGVRGVVRFAWWGHGFGRWYGFAPRYAGWGGRGYWAGARWVAPHVAYAPPHAVVRGPVSRGVHGWHGVHGRR
jgi:hypothetical protein